MAKLWVSSRSQLVSSITRTKANGIAEATMVRNAGGRAFDAIRTLAVLQTIGQPGTIVVMHHTDCGMTHFHDDAIKDALLQVAPEEKDTIENLKFGEIKGSWVFQIERGERVADWKIGLRRVSERIWPLLELRLWLRRLLSLLGWSTIFIRDFWVRLERRRATFDL